MIRPGPEIGAFVELALSTKALARIDMPPFAYRIRQSRFVEFVTAGGIIEERDLILGLMDWLDHTDMPEPVLDLLDVKLAQCCPPNGERGGRCCFESEFGNVHGFYLGDVDWACEVGAWQRGDWLIAAASRAPEDSLRMRVNAPRAISLEVGRAIFNHAMPMNMVPYDSMDGLRSSSSSTSSYYACAAGRTTTIYWDYGLGNSERNGALIHDGPDIPKSALAPNQLAWMVALANGFLSKR